jgi:hypothetical protein
LNRGHLPQWARLSSEFLVYCLVVGLRSIVRPIIGGSAGNSKVATLPAQGRQALDRRSTTRSWRSLSILRPIALVVIAVSLWAISLAGADLNPGRMSDLGLISVLPFATYVAFAILIVSFCLVVRHRTTPTGILLLHVISLIVMIHGVTSIFYETLRLEWAWKHVGVTAYYQEYGTDATSEVLSRPWLANRVWPGFFAASAVVTETAGFASALSFASWSPLVFNLLYLGPLILIFRSFSADQRLVWLGLWFFFMTQWIFDDYFSPQGMAYLLFLVILGICVRWFRPISPNSEEPPQYSGVLGRVRTLLNRILAGPQPDGTITPSTSSAQRVGLVAIIIVLFSAMAASHQLTPYLTIAVVIALVLFRRCSQRNLPVLMIVIAVGWLLFPAYEFFTMETGKFTASFGRLLSNIDANFSDHSLASSGQVLVARMSQVLSVTVWTLALLGVVRRLRHNCRDLTCILIAVSPFFILLLNSYGREMPQRVFLISLPGMAFLAAALLIPSPRAGKSLATTVLTIALSAGLLLSFVVAHFGRDNAFVFTQNEVIAVEHLVDIAPAGAHIVQGAGNYPNWHRYYGDHTYWTIEPFHPNDTEEVANEIHSTLSDTERWPAVYMIITRSQKAVMDRMGWMLPGTLESLEQSMKESDKFRLVYANDDASIFAASATSQAQDGRE